MHKLHTNECCMPPSIVVTIIKGVRVLFEDLMNGDLPPSSLELSYDGSQSPASSGSLVNQTRTKRMRTSFKHHQLRTMKSYFAINQNPDAKDLKQLAQKTGLSKRVLQVGILLHLQNTESCLIHD